MIDISTWLNDFLQALDAIFAERVWFVGLQGSYGRGEATEQSDIDVVVILDELSATDIEIYGAMLDRLAYRNLICGFLSGKNELLSWEPSNLFQFYHDTRPIRGTLDDLLPLLDDAAVARAIQIGACNIYHGCVHNMLHEKSDEILQGLYKSASFVVRAIAFLQNGVYISNLNDLARAVSKEDGILIEMFLKIKDGSEISFDEMSAILFDRTKKWIAKEGTV